MEAARKDLSGEHAEFVPLIAAIEHAEASVGEQEAALLRIEAAGVHESLAHGLIPHAIGEGRTLFPVLRRITGSSEVSTAMNADHREIARITDELDRLRLEIERSGMNRERGDGLARVLHALRAVVERHFEEEERVCFQILKAELPPEEAHRMCDAIEHTAAEIRNLYE